MTQLEMRNLIRQEIKDQIKSAEATDQLRWSIAQLCTQINLSAKFIAQEFLHIMGSTAWSTVAGTQNYAFAASDNFIGYPAGITWIDYITVSGGNHYNIPLSHYVNFTEFMHLAENLGNTSAPDFWTFWSGSMYIEPPSWALANSLTVYHYEKQAELAIDATDDAVELSGDETLHPLIAYHASAEVARQDKAISLSTLLERKYQIEYNRQRRFRGPKFAGPQFTATRDF